jgi:replicative DNA helicase
MTGVFKWDNHGSLPSNIMAEESVLGTVLLGGKETFEKAKSWIRDDNAFYTTDNKRVWQTFEELYKNKEHIDVVTVTNKARNIFGNKKISAYFITGLTSELPSRSKVEDYSRIVWEKYIQRETAKSAQVLYGATTKSLDDTKTILIKHKRLVNELENLQPSAIKDTDQLITEAELAVKEGGNIIKFNTPYLDRFAGGILRNLMGQDLKVMLFNREMTNEETFKRIFAMEGHKDNVSYSDIRNGDFEMSKEMNFNKIVEKVREKYVSDKFLVVDHIRTLEDTLIEIGRHKPDVVIDDYIQLIKVSSFNKNKDRRFEIEEILNQYKWACKEHNCHAILVSQLNREIERRLDPRPKMSDYSESGVIEQTAETALFVYYPYNHSPEENNKYESEIITAKTRYGEIGRFIIGFDGNRCRFFPTPQEAQLNVTVDTRKSSKS